MECAGPHFKVIGLMDDTSLICPVTVEGENEIMKGHKFPDMARRLENNQTIVQTIVKDLQIHGESFIDAGQANKNFDKLSRHERPTDRRVYDV